MDSFFEKASRLRVLDSRPADEIMGYDRFSGDFARTDVVAVAL